jgi:hypothetical protein
VAKFRHLSVAGTESAEAYGYPFKPRSQTFKTPARNRNPHADALRQQLSSLDLTVRAEIGSGRRGPEDGIVVEFVSEPGFDLWVGGLENRVAGIELLNVRKQDGEHFATVFVPPGKLAFFFQRVDQYAIQLTDKGKPRHGSLIESISKVRLAVLRAFWTDRPDLFPATADQNLWWEVWLRTPDPNTQDSVFAAFVALATAGGFRLGQQVVRFPERLVLIAFGTVRHWEQSPKLHDLLAELRKAKEVPTEYLTLTPGERAEYALDAERRVTFAGAGAPAVCLLDTGVNRPHPLLRQAVSESDVLTADAEWGTSDHEGHGTQMAGIALYGSELADFLGGSERIQLRHRLESVKMLPPRSANHPDNYGAITQAAVARAEVANPDRPRVICMAVTADDRDYGHPSSWSGALDQHSAGALDGHRRLYVVPVGNIRELLQPGFRYPSSNRETYGACDPAQSWNALTVGACTHRIHIRSEDFSGWQPVAPSGGLAPMSRTSMMWAAHVCPLKPDIVLEGGNYARTPSGSLDACTDLEMLTTVLRPTGQLFDSMRDTSAATALAAGLAASIQAEYPDVWPETVRGLMVHCARWTPRMREEFAGNKKSTFAQLLRCYGYGIPSLDRALFSLRNRVVLTYQGELQPYELVDGAVKYKDFHLHALPWPKAALQSLAGEPVQVRITLSYFIEPSPDRRGYGTKHRYASHGLRFKVIGPLEQMKDFRERVSMAAWEDSETPPDNRGELQDWALGPTLRCRGSLHSDWWTGTGAEIAECRHVAVHPVSGWWKDRKHLGKHDKRARYSLIISLETPATDVDLYTPIATEIGVATPVEITG